MKYFFERLKEERKRLGLNQDEFAALGGVKKGAQFNYENGSRTPDSDYLAAIADAGVDVLYLLTGGYSTSALPSDENELLIGYRRLDVRSKARVLGLIEGIVEPAHADEMSLKSKPESAKPTVVFHGKVGQQVTGDVTGKQTFNLGNKKK
ncbi:helix-turn-helix domain-containing protein [Janthinobacterium sp. HLX7-2]|uniref:helix-turn-helix domain-containing protein n=1 Tax=Janthinobacterium sp. HLX7-2 TaxID=1259331 RepID=UPI003F2072F5